VQTGKASNPKAADSPASTRTITATSSALQVAFTVDIDSLKLALLDETVPSELPPPPPPSTPDAEDVYMDATEGAFCADASSLASSPVYSVTGASDVYQDAMSHQGSLASSFYSASGGEP
jgi:hypothetical protein